MIFCVLKRHAKWSNLTRALSYQDPMKASIATTRSMPKSSVHSITRYLVMTSKHIDQCPIYLQSIKVMIFGRYKLRNSDTFIWPHDRTMCNCSKKILLFCYKITFHCHENCIRLKYFKYFEWKWKSATIFVQKMTRNLMVRMPRSIKIRQPIQLDDSLMSEINYHHNNTTTTITTTNYTTTTTITTRKNDTTTTITSATP